MINLIHKLFGDPNEKEIKKIWPLVYKINELENHYQETLQDEYFPAKTLELKKRLKEGETVDDILPEAFALVKNACRRLVGKKWMVRGQEVEWNMIPFDVQLLGAVVLHQGKIAEMKTGEGKTLVCTMAIYLNALEGRGVYLVTVNEYLAHRDAEWMRGLFEFLGLSVGIISQGQSHLEKKEAYNADVTYGTNNEFGFDYLRDNMSTDPEHMVQRELNYAIVDEVDSILIDEARTPLIISNPAEESTEKYYRYARLIPQLQESEDYEVDEKMRAATLTEGGISKLEKLLGMDNIYAEGGFAEVHHIEQSLKAQAIFKRDTDYVVQNGEVVIVDEFTGRLMPGRRYSDGLHQALEAKENVEVHRESRTLATISFQNYFRLFKKLAGMTGTALTEAGEFANIYKLETLVMPTNRILARQDLPDSVYKNQRGKYSAVVKRVQELHKKKQPVLIGTISIEKSEILSKLLTDHGVPHTVLNAKQHEREAEIVAMAGQMGAVTIATNMAGRGTDIKLGEGVSDLGGLYILGTERHESRRIDNQLRGRSGRQGDPGTSQFFVSMDDELMRLFGGERVQKMMEFLKVPDDMPIENGIISNSIESAQKKVEGRNFEIRKHLVDYDDVMNKQREIVYKRRRTILFSTDIKNNVLLLLEKEAERIVLAHTPGNETENWDYAAIHKLVEAIAGESKDDFSMETFAAFDRQDDMIDYVKHYFWKVYAARERSIPDFTEEEGSKLLRSLERSVYLRSIDIVWMEHIDNMSRLREGVALRGYGQKDPLIEYKREAFEMFTEMLGTIQRNAINALFKFEIQREQPHPVPVQIVNEPQKLQTNQTQIEGVLAGDRPVMGANPFLAKPQQPNVSATISQPEVGRNDPCFCGSGKKYKKCHGQA
ncbi:preprotein translocase subunit SecA [Candidatus Peregrinibacteria bacterium CG_4_9_14_0_2_um_filter_53_11]|nr:MAG: preprotein translocase subunit SecA [Candidatus Peregrinibacteria bacterium CG_4_9_14_0_2_um_filter_53_11]